MESNTKAFIELLRAGLWADAELTVLLDQGFTEPVDWGYVYRLAEEQAVVGLMAAGFDYAKDIKVPQEDVLQFVGIALQIEQQNLAMNEFVAELIEKLRYQDVYAILVKGQGIAQCYNRPLWRANGDVDLYLNESNYEKAKKILLPLASDIDEEKKTLKHLAMTIDSWVVELHGSLRSQWLPSSVNNMIDQVHYNIFHMGEVRSWDNNNTIVYLPAPQNDVLLVFTHILEHFFVGGIGLRQICDWCRLLWTYKNSLNQELLETRICKAGLMSEWKTFAALAVEYLGMSEKAMPLYDSDRRWKNKAKRVLSFVMKTGNLGHNKDVSYTERYPYVVRKLISFWNHIKECATLFPIFPLDTCIVLLKLFYGRLGVLIKGK